MWTWICYCLVLIRKSCEQIPNHVDAESCWYLISSKKKWVWLLMRYKWYLKISQLKWSPLNCVTLAKVLWNTTLTYVHEKIFKIGCYYSHLRSPSRSLSCFGLFINGCGALASFLKNSGFFLEFLATSFKTGAPMCSCILETASQDLKNSDTWYDYADGKKISVVCDKEYISD